MSEFIVTLMLNFVADFYSLADRLPLLDPKAFSPMTVPIKTPAGCRS
jgi:hypothetical protein